LVLRAGFKKKKGGLYFELMICDKYRGKNTGPQCVKMLLQVADTQSGARDQVICIIDELYKIGL
jgi:hypothetical protein